VSPPLMLVLGAIAGVVRGAVFFGGLWWTSKQLVSGGRHASFVALSFVSRMVVLAGGLVVLARIDPWLLIGALPGLIAARIGWIRSVGPLAVAGPPEV